MSLVVIAMAFIIVGLSVQLFRTESHYRGKIGRLAAHKARDEERHHDTMQQLYAAHDEISELEKRLYEQPTADELAYVFESLGAQVPAHLQDQLRHKNEVLDGILSDLEALEAE